MTTNNISNQTRKAGKFATKDYGNKELRSIRLSDEAWEILGSQATESGKSRTDLIEELARTEVDEQAIILKALKQFITRQQSQFGSIGSQKGKEFSTSTRNWDCFNKFVQLVESEPSELDINK